MKNIPTAEEFWLKNNGQLQSGAKMMIEFAKLHVEAALKTVWANSAEWENGFNLTIRVIDDDEELILNSYPLTNIK